MIITSLILVSCFQEEKIISSEKRCTLDSDCTGATCCHITEAVNKDNAPNCKGSICTLECMPDTLDCGTGEIKCVNNECLAVLK